MRERVLGPDESVPRRPFTSVKHYQRDLGVLTAMLEDVRSLLARAAAGAIEIAPHKTIAWKVHGLKRRVIVCDVERLQAAKKLFVVGFLAERQREVDIRELERANAGIVKEFPQYPGILSYSSRELHNYNWANLVLNDGPEVTEQWRASASHRRAVEVLSPVHYRHVRIHHGRLPGGLGGGRWMILSRTRYVDYRAREPWRALRELDPVGVS